MLFKKYKYFFLLFGLLILTNCSDDENILLSTLFFGEEGQGITLSDYEVAWDYSLAGTISASNNGVINRGEQIYLIVKLKNTSSGMIQDVSARLRTDNEHINILTNGFVSFGNINSSEVIESHDNYLTTNGQFYSYYAFVFQVYSTLPANSTVNFILDIYAGNELHNLEQFVPDIR